MEAKIKTLRVQKLFDSIFHLIHFGLTKIICRTGNLAHRIDFITKNAQKSISCQIRRGGPFTPSGSLAPPYPTHFLDLGLLDLWSNR